MLLLIIDTSGKHGNVALARADADKLELIEEIPLVGGTFSAQLVPQIAILLSRHGFQKNEISAFVVVSGPGSFTGLRVGLAAIKGFAEILRKPIVPVSLLEAVAISSAAQGTILAALDAGRDEFYVGEFEINDAGVRLIREQLQPRSALLTIANGTVVATPDQALARMASDAGVSVRNVETPGAQIIAQLGWKKLQSGATVSPDQLEANYLRRSDAEIFAKPTP